jgi:hypothetical protein
MAGVVPMQSNTLDCKEKGKGGSEGVQCENEPIREEPRTV